MTQECKKCKQEFVLEKNDLSFYEKMKVPAPVNCPDCRFKWRALFRNEINLYSRTCVLCGHSTLSMYHPASLYTVYCSDCWLSEKWDPYSYGQDYDPKKPFFEQMGELLRRVPKTGIFASSDVGPNINSKYTNFAGGNKNCYFIFNSGPNNEECAYSRGLILCREALDSYYANKAEKLYEAVNVNMSSGVVWAQNADNCIDSAFLLNCSDCQNCFGCVNLRHQSHRFLNEPLSRSEYLKRVSEVMGSYKKIEEFRAQFEKFSLRFPRKENNNLKNVNVSGDYIFESKNCRQCFEASFCEDSKFLFSNKYTKSCYDLIGHGRKSELLLECVAVGSSSHIISSWWTTSSHDVAYSFGLRSSEYCFGCDSVRNGQYVILNKRYNKEEYEKIRSKIVAELEEKNLYGLYFPPELAPFAYNETIAQDNFPLTKEEVFAQGFRWEENIQKTEGKETIQPKQIPDHIKDALDSITSEILKCVDCNRNYKIINQELLFYRKMNIPIPRKCFYCRYQNRIVRRGPYKFWKRECAKCGKEITTNYSPDRSEIVYCEKCYQAEVY
ncbi:hypothetical protein HYW72_00160 [Candidatus Nomurabacteria bacterium]|nr:hypothetical protein [Candidatus Nomurabacteria bacterium]